MAELGTNDLACGQDRRDVILECLQNGGTGTSACLENSHIVTLACNYQFRRPVGQHAGKVAIYES
jgi:hypothetical protein